MDLESELEGLSDALCKETASGRATSKVELDRVPSLYPKYHINALENNNNEY